MSNIENFDIRNYTIDSIVETFDSMVSMEIEVSDSEPPDTAAAGDMVATINFAGDIIGFINIQVTSKLATLMLANRLDIEPAQVEDNGEIKNMLAEISNIVGGNLKTALNDAGHACDNSKPSVTDGSDAANNPSHMDRFERYVFSYREDLFFVEVGLKNQSASGDEIDSSSSAVVAKPEHVDVEPEKDIPYPVGDVATEDNPAEEEVAVIPQEVNEVQETTAAELGVEDTPQPESASRPAAAQIPEPLPAAFLAREATSPSPETTESKSLEDFDLDLLLDIPLEIKVELGRTKIQIQELLNLAPGSAVKLVTLEGEPVDILANDTLIARGEVVVQNEKYGIRVTEITGRIDRVRSFSI